ncbi:MAG TPA: SpaA isopeptide-forming pilin-related protein [Clostridia bacterium]|nr:SpaA isopeptide-forming pilin-related protein [Clostridia bacterium]
MKLIRKRILPLLLMALLLIMALPMQALAAPDGDAGWTQYGKAGHATASGDTVSFAGHPTDPFTTLLFRPAQDGDYRTFTFHLTEGNSDWHTLEGSGFVFNAVTDGTTLNGYAVLFGQSNVGYYKLTNVSMAALASTQFTGLSGVTLIQQEAKPAYSSGTTWYLKLQVSPGSLSFYKYSDTGFSSGQTAIFSNVAIDDSVGSGYGPFGSFISHNCSVISTSSFEYFTLKISPNTAPAITAPDVVIDRGGAFDPESNVSAADAEDGDLSGKVQITSNNVNVNVPGVYQVVYSVADILGLTGTHTRNVTVRADVELIAVDAVTGDPLAGVGFSLDGDDLSDTSAEGKTGAVIDPGTHDWEVTKAHPDYISPDGESVLIDGTKFSTWPAQIRIPFVKKTYDMALAVQLAKVNDTPAADGVSAKYGDTVAYQLRITNNGNQPAVPTVALNIPTGLTATEATASKLPDGKLVLTQPIEPGAHTDVELTFKVSSVAASASLVLQGKAITVALPDGTPKTDINLNDNDDEAPTPIQNPPIILTVVNALDKTDKLSGAELKLTDKDGKTVFTGSTGEKGTVEINGLYPGQYTITQTKVTAGYQLPDKTWTVTKADDGTVSGTTEIPNDPTLVLVTDVEVLDDKTEKLLPGGTITIVGADGKEVQAGTLGEKGDVSFRYMKPGKYTLRQTKAPLGYVLQVKEYPFEITAEGKVTGDTKIVNVPTVVVITKLDPDKKPVAEAAYEVYNSENKKVSDGKTDKDGKLTVKYLPAGKYTYKETKAPSGYALNPTAYAFEIDEKGVVTGTLSVTDPFANIVIKKVDAKTNKVLAGAQFGLYDSTDKLLGTLTTDNNGLAQFTKLAWGKYSVKELKAPSGYSVNGKLVTVEITETYQNPAEPHIVENSPAAQTGVDGFPWWGIALLAVCVVGGGGCAWYLLRKKQPAVDKRRAKRDR